MSKVFKFSLAQLTNRGPHPNVPVDIVKCGGCNWETSHLYVLADSEEEAIDLIRRHPCYGCANCDGFSWEHSYDFPSLPDCTGWEESDLRYGDFAGMCGECLAEFLASSEPTITLSNAVL